MKTCRAYVIRVMHETYIHYMKYLICAIHGSLGLLFLAASWAALPAPGDESFSEQRVKAVFLYKFAAYVDWPEAVFAQAKTPFVIGVIDNDPIEADLNQVVAGRTIKDHPIMVKQLQRGDSLAGVHILFVRLSGERAQEWLSAADGLPVLTVTEDGNRSKKTGVLHFIVENNRVRFEASRDAADRNGLRLSAQLLAVARQVRGGH